MLIGIFLIFKFSIISTNHFFYFILRIDQTWKDYLVIACICRCIFFTFYEKKNLSKCVFFTIWYVINCRHIKSLNIWCYLIVEIYLKWNFFFRTFTEQTIFLKILSVATSCLQTKNGCWFACLFFFFLFLYFLHNVRAVPN